MCTLKLQNNLPSGPSVEWWAVTSFLVNSLGGCQLVFKARSLPLSCGHWSKFGSGVAKPPPPQSSLYKAAPERVPRILHVTLYRDAWHR